MALTLSDRSDQNEPLLTRFETESDLISTGRIGRARLLVTAAVASRFEQTPLGEELVGDFELAKLTNPRIEDLVDATALLADYEGRTVELLRATNRRSLQLAGAEKRLVAILAGEEMPEIMRMRYGSARNAVGRCLKIPISAKAALIAAKLC